MGGRAAQLEWIRRVRTVRLAPAPESGPDVLRSLPPPPQTLQDVLAQGRRPSDPDHR
jgi:hypothetical protein